MMALVARMRIRCRQPVSSGSSSSAPARGVTRLTGVFVDGVVVTGAGG